MMTLKVLAFDDFSVDFFEYVTGGALGLSRLGVGSSTTTSTGAVGPGWLAATGTGAALFGLGISWNRTDTLGAPIRTIVDRQKLYCPRHR